MINTALLIGFLAISAPSAQSANGGQESPLRFPENMFRKATVTASESRLAPTIVPRDRDHLMELLREAGNAEDKRTPDEFTRSLPKWIEAGLYNLVITEAERYRLARNLGEESSAFQFELAEAHVYVQKPEKAFCTLEGSLGRVTRDTSLMTSLAAILKGTTYPDQEEYLKREFGSTYPAPRFPTVRDRMLYLNLILLSGNNRSGPSSKMRFARWAYELAAGDPYATVNYAMCLWDTGKLQEPLELLKTAKPTDHYETNFLISDVRAQIQKQIDARDGGK